MHASRSPIGVDLGARLIKAVQLERHSDGWHVAAAVALPRREPDGPVTATDVARLTSALRRQGFAGSRIVLAAPTGTARAELMELPPRSSGAPIDDIARAEICRTQKRAAGSFEMALWDVPDEARGAGQMSMMTAVYPHDEAEHLLDVFEAAGWRVAAVDLQACALARACAAAAPGLELAAALDIGATCVVFQLMCRDVVVYVRRLENLGLGTVHDGLHGQFGLNPEMTEHLLRDVGLLEGEVTDGPSTSAMAGALGLIAGYVERLAREVGTSLSYAAHLYRDSAVQRLMLTGGGAAMPGLDAMLTRELAADVQVIRPSDLAACAEPLRSRCGSPALAAAAGLALFDT